MQTMGIWGRIILGVTLLAAAMPGRAAEPADEDPSLDINPATIEGRTVSRADPIYVQVRLKAGSRDLHDVVVSSFSNDGVAPLIEGGASAAAIPELKANSEYLWTLRLAPGRGDALPPTGVSVNVGAAFKYGRDDKDPPRQHFLFGVVKITGPPTTTIPALADIDVKGSLQALSHERPSQLYVIVTNKSAQALRLTDVRISAPKFIAVTGPGAEEFQKAAVAGVPFDEARVLSYDVTAADQVVPGKYSVVVVVSATTPDGTTGSIVKVQEIELAILGESDLLNKLGAPSLLFLPGALFLLSWQLLWSIGKTTQQRQDFLLTPTAGAFWVVAIALSLLGAFAYPVAVRIAFKQDRDYLGAYGLRDYMYVFALTIALAVLSFVVWRLPGWLVALYERWLAWATTPEETDTPLALLKKLGRLGKRIAFTQAHAAGGNVAQLVLVLAPWRETASLWIAPPAQLQASDHAPPEALDVIQQVATGAITGARQLAEEIEKGLHDRDPWWAGGQPKEPWWTLTWQPVGTVRHLVKVPATEWTEIGAEARLVRSA